MPGSAAGSATDGSATGSEAGDDQCTSQEAKKVGAMHGMIDTQRKDLQDLLHEAKDLEAQGCIPAKVVSDASQALLEGEAALATITALKESNKQSLYESNMEDCKKAKEAMQSAKKILTGAIKRAKNL